MPVLLLALVQRPVRLLVVRERRLRQLVELRVGRPLLPMVRLLLAPYLAQPPSLRVDRVVPPAFHLLP